MADDLTPLEIGQQDRDHWTERIWDTEPADPDED